MSDLRYFQYGEFDSPDKDGSGKPENEGGCMNYNFLCLLDIARENAGVPFKITSGYRTPAHNAKVGGRLGSSHLKGLAVDIACSDSATRGKIITGLFLAGLGRRIGIAKDFIHVDMDMDKPACIWLY